MPAEQNKAAIVRFYEEAIGKGNVDVIDELMWPDFVHHGDALFPHIEGSAAIKAGVGGVKGAFPDGHTIVEDMVAEGETVVCRLSWKGTHEGAFMGSEPTHQVMSWKGISHLSLRERQDQGAMGQPGRPADAAADGPDPRDRTQLTCQWIRRPQKGSCPCRSKKIRNLVKRYDDEILNRRNYDALPGLVTDDLVDPFAPPGAPGGPDAARQALEMMVGEHPGHEGGEPGHHRGG